MRFFSVFLNLSLIFLSFSSNASTIAVDTFSIGSNEFLATGKIIDEYPFLYKTSKDDKEVNFTLHQIMTDPRDNVPSNGIESFTINNEHFLMMPTATQNSDPLNSVLYRWNENTQLFESFQYFTARGDSTWDYFTSINPEGIQQHYLISGARFSDTPLLIYRYENNKFVLYQEINIGNVNDVEIINDNTDQYMFVVTNTLDAIYLWDSVKQNFTEQRTIITDTPNRSAHAFNLDGQIMLAVMGLEGGDTQAKSHIYIWDKGALKLFQEFMVVRGSHFLHIHIDNIDYLFMANLGGDLYRYSAKDKKFIFEQTILYSTVVYSATTLVHQGNTYLVMGTWAQSLNEDTTLVYRYDDILKRFESYQSLY